jgi:hypothetical protein
MGTVILITLMSVRLHRQTVMEKDILTTDYEGLRCALYLYVTTERPAAGWGVDGHWYATESGTVKSHHIDPLPVRHKPSIRVWCSPCSAGIIVSPRTTLFVHVISGHWGGALAHKNEVV